MFLEITAVVFIVGFGIAYFFSTKYTTSTSVTANAGSIVSKSYASLQDRPRTLSIVVPCYNEAKRLPPMLTDTLQFMANSVKDNLISDFELVLVNDCSKDDTVAVATAFLKAHYPTVKFQTVSYTPNAGKGMAVRRGFFASSGEYVLMVDADNATRIDDLTKLLRVAVDEKVPVVVGSRAHLEEHAVASRTLLRTLLMRAFHLVVAVTYFCGTYGSLCPIRDTQCGFKLFHRRDSLVLFLNNRLARWAFDVELLLLARRCRMTVREVSVQWEEIEGSKVRLSGMVQMGLECLLMCVAYPFQMWRIVATSTLESRAFAAKKKN
jgi:dolichyl-phosphate beta-glucosyltransferase